MNSDTQITATAPAGSVGSASVTVTTPQGTSNGQTFTYVNAPIFAGDPPPTWRAVQNGTVNQVAGIQSNDINQFLVTHAAQIFYAGTLNPNGEAQNFGTGGTNWGLQLSLNPPAAMGLDPV